MQVFILPLPCPTGCTANNKRHPAKNGRIEAIIDAVFL